MAEHPFAAARAEMDPDERKRRLSRVYAILPELALQAEAACLDTQAINLSRWVELGPSLWRNVGRDRFARAAPDPD
jgi:hypothetical protein